MSTMSQVRWNASSPCQHGDGHVAHPLFLRVLFPRREIQGTTAISDRRCWHDGHGTVNFLCVFNCCTTSMRTSPQRIQHRTDMRSDTCAGLTEMATSTCTWLLLPCSSVQSLCLSSLCARGSSYSFWADAPGQHYVPSRIRFFVLSL